MKTLFKFILLSSFLFAFTSCADDVLSVSKEGEINFDMTSVNTGEVKSDVDIPDADIVVGGNPEGYIWTYNICLSFTDSEGNDLVKQLVDEEFNYLGDSRWNLIVNPEKCHLDVIYSNPPSWYDNSIYNARANPGFTPDVHNRYFTFNQTELDMSVSPWYLKYQDMTGTLTWGEDVQDLLLKITSPTLFGDGVIHDVATYWEEGEERAGAEMLAKCSKVVYKGQEYLPVKKVKTEHHESGKYVWDAIFVDYYVDIVLDK